MATREALAHLLPRATFGPTAEEVDAAERAGYEQTVAALLAPGGPDAGTARTPGAIGAADPYLALGREPGREARQRAASTCTPTSGSRRRASCASSTPRWCPLWTVWPRRRPASAWW